jgi:hypothetical protein
MDVPGGEIGQRAVALILKLVTQRAVGAGRAGLMTAPERLQLALLVL